MSYVLGSSLRLLSYFAIWDVSAYKQLTETDARLPTYLNSNLLFIMPYQEGRSFLAVVF